MVTNMILLLIFVEYKSKNDERKMYWDFLHISAKKNNEENKTKVETTI